MSATAGLRSAALLVLLLPATSAAAPWAPAWNITVEPVAGRSFLRGACVRKGTLHVTAVVTTTQATDPRPVLYSIPLADAPPAARRQWQGPTVIGPETGLSAPVCGPDGVAFLVRESAAAAVDLVRVGEDGGISTRKLSGLPVAELAALRSRRAGEWILALRPSARVFLATADGETRELAIEDLSEDENAVDLCVTDRDLLLLTSGQPDRPVGLLKLRKWTADLERDGTRQLRGTFAGLLCGPDGTADVLQLQPQGAGVASWALARFGPGLSGPRTQVVDAAALGSLDANGAWSGGSAYWAVANYKAASVYEVGGGEGGARLAWRDADPRFGATTTAPAIASAPDGGLVLVYEAYDRSATGLPVVLRAVGFKR